MNAITLPTRSTRGIHSRALRWPILSPEALALAASTFFTLFLNHAFWRAVIATGDLHGPTGWLSLMSLVVLIIALHAFLLLLLLWPGITKPVVCVLLMISSVAAHYMTRFPIYLDADMLRNVLHTDGREASELLSLSMLPSVLLLGVLPSLVVWRTRIKRRPMLRAIAIRGCWLTLVAVVAAGSAMASYQDLSALMRSHHQLRYLVTPANYLVALAGALSDQRATITARAAVGEDARVAVRSKQAKPRLLILVVGETVRAQNWGLNGYMRQTTPELARIQPVNFSTVTACGSSTEVSLPCMFSVYGRANYDETRIRHSDSLLHILDRAGIATQWRDNQTGCKGVCEGLPFITYRTGSNRNDCPGEECMDEVMLSDLAEEIARHRGDTVLVLHQLGNHGPSYYKRYPPQFRQYEPTCDSDDLGDCSQEEIVNAYDNAVLYTDAFVARAIRLLERQSSHDAALIYVSDHGESLGEAGLYLHGLPYAIAPKTQLQVPLTIWISPELLRSRAIDMECLRKRTAQPASHDNLFHSVLGLMEVQTRVHVDDLDLFAGCDGKNARTALHVP